VLLPVVVLLVQAAFPDSVARPIRVWLGAEQPVPPGAAVQVFVRTTIDGYLTVLRRSTDGRIEVLFPTVPADQAFVPRGTYEVRGLAESGAFAAREPPGTGLVLAALSPAPFRTREFVHQAAWNPDALTPSWAEADAEGALSDIVQRMLGDGYFMYDLVPYVVAPPRPAPQPPIAGAGGYETCVGCVFPMVTVVVPYPAFVCDPFFLLCDDLFFVGRRDPFDRHPAEPEARQGRVLGIPSGGGAPRGVAASRAAGPRYVTPDRPAGPTPIDARSRVPEQPRSRGGAVEGGVPVLRGRQPPQSANARPVPIQLRSRAVRLAAVGPASVPARSRAPVAGATTPAGAAVSRPGSLLARPHVVVPARPAAAATRTVAGPGRVAQVRAAGRGDTRSAGAAQTAPARASGRAATPVRRRP
jgi:hypothetical protein